MDQESEIKREAQSKRILHWNYRGFVELPSELERDCRNVREIYLKHNRIAFLPPWISYLTNLSALYLNNNKLKEIPQEIGLLTKLTDLNLSSNCLSALPSEIKSLHSLTTLIVNDNNLTNLPPDFDQLKSLKTLNVSCNGIHVLPYTISLIVSLEELYVDGNPIFELPTDIFALPNLRELSANCCDLRCLPAIPLAANPVPNISLNMNPGLKHIPLTLEPIFEINASLFSGFRTYDCSQIVHPNQIRIVIKNYKNIPQNDIYFFSGLEKLCHYAKNEIPTLVEIALRAAYETHFKKSNSKTPENNDKSTMKYILDKLYSSGSENNDESSGSSTDDNNNNSIPLEIDEANLPRDLNLALKTKRSGICQNCQISLFKYCVLLLLKRTIKRFSAEGDLLCSALFCSSRCVFEWSKKTDFDINQTVQWFSSSEILYADEDN